MGLLTNLGIRKRPPKEPPRESRKHSRVAVHLMDGRTVVHYAKFNTRLPNGGLKLHDKESGDHLIAIYAPGVWHSMTTGTRKVSNPER